MGVGIFEFYYFYLLNVGNDSGNFLRLFRGINEILKIVFLNYISCVMYRMFFIFRGFGWF